MSALILDMQGLVKSFTVGGARVLDGLDLSLRHGESLALIGTSGIGKSVLLKCLLGLTPLNAGTILLDGQDITHMSGHHRRRVMRRFGVLFQHAALFDSLSVWRNVAFAFLYTTDPGQRLSPLQARRKAEEQLEIVGLNPALADSDIAALSGGMRKRVGLARAIATKPDILLLDEPTTGLDPVTANMINGIIADCIAHLGSTVIAATHDIPGTRRIATRVAMLDKGKLCWDGPVDNLDNSHHPQLDNFVRHARGAIA